MGVSWIMDIISFWTGGSAYFWIIPEIINICTGILVFVLFVLKPNVWKLLKGRRYPSLKQLDICCLPCMLEQSSNHIRGKRRSHYPQQKHQGTTSSSFDDEGSSNSRKISSTIDLSNSNSV
jgi:hypothetical protein